MEDEIKQIRQIKLSIIVVLVTLVIFAGGVALVQRKSFEETIKKETKIENLINEVGTLKAINDDLSNQLKTVKDSVTSINEVHSAAKKTEEELKAALKDKEETINALASKNKDMADIINLPPYSKNITNYLIIGQNMKLTDTMIIASINPDKEKITLISVPRDLYYNGRRINEIYEFYGINKLEEALYKVTGLYVSKYVIFDFNSFKTIVDSVDGIEINVEKALTDYNYPGPKKSYITVSFDSGIQTMDGDTALKYARSRKSTSDFDRSRRQQEVIQAVINKAKDLDLINKIDLSLKIYAKILPNIETDINFYDALADFTKYKNFTINSPDVLSTKNYLYSTTGAVGQYMLLPKAKNFNKIQQYIYEEINS